MNSRVQKTYTFFQELVTNLKSETNIRSLCLVKFWVNIYFFLFEVGVLEKEFKNESIFFFFVRQFKLCRKTTNKYIFEFEKKVVFFTF